MGWMIGSEGVGLGGGQFVPAYDNAQLVSYVKVDKFGINPPKLGAI